MQPVNYAFANPQEAIVNGLNIGGAMADREAKQLKQQQEQQAALQQQADLRALAMNPNAGHAEYAGLMTKYPALAENLSKAFKIQDDGAKQNALNFGTRVYSALLAGNNDLATTLVEERAKADPGKAQDYSVFASLIKQSPATAKTLGAMQVAALMGPEKFATAFPSLNAENRAIEQAPADLLKKEADASAAVSDATIKGEKAKVAAQDVALELEKKGWDIKALKADIDYKKESNRIAAINSAIAREGNQLKKQELQMKVDEAIATRDQKVRDKVATAEAGATNIDNMLNTVQRILKNPSLNDVLGSIEGRLPTVFSDEAADATALIETLGSQAFLAQIPNIKGMGALSNAEGEKLQSALQNLSRVQSEKQFRASLNEASRLLMKGRENLSKSTGVPLPKPDTPAAPGARPPLSSFDKP